MLVIIKKVKEGKLAAVEDQSSLNTKASIANITAEVENYRQQNVRKLAQAHG
jgi:hypothetical protein